MSKVDWITDFLCWVAIGGIISISIFAILFAFSLPYQIKEGVMQMKETAFAEPHLDILKMNNSPVEDIADSNNKIEFFSTDIEDNNYLFSIPFNDSNLRINDFYRNEGICFAHNGITQFCLVYDENIGWIEQDLNKQEKEGVE